MKIRRHNERADGAIICALGELGVATIHEAQGRTGLMHPYLRPIYPTARVAGSALTIECAPGDNLMIHAALEVAREGDVLVVGLTKVADREYGMFGDLLATSCRARGVEALIIDAGVRDVVELKGMKFPVWSKSISALGTLKETAGLVNETIVCAGVTVNPGDVIVGDQDGVVVVKRAEASDVLKAALARVEKEIATRKRLAAGELGIDIYGLRAKLRALGVEYEE